uniref:Uncharacterized protein n=1 Tax=Hucho hucho TaxID=62062 RepID=A0A4W5M0U3_9TELE
MHVDDFVAAEFKDVGTPLGLLPPKRPPKSSPKPPTRGLFTGNRGRAAFHSQQTRFFTPPQPKGVLLSGNYNARREGGRGGTSWSGPLPPVTHRGTYSDARGGQSNFTRGPLPSRQQPAGTHTHMLVCTRTYCINTHTHTYIFREQHEYKIILACTITDGHPCSSRSLSLSLFQVRIAWLRGTAPLEVVGVQACRG